MTLVLCFGNPLRGDDAVGWRVAEQLAAVTAAAEVIIFVNASAGARPGEVHCTRIHPANAPAATQHGDTTAGLLALAKTRYHSRPAAYLITIAAEQFEMGTPLSPAVTDAPRAVALIEAFAAQAAGSSSPKVLTNAG